MATYAEKSCKLRRYVQQHSPDLQLKPLKRGNERRVIREIALFEADLPTNMRYFAQQIQWVAVRFIRVIHR